MKSLCSCIIKYAFNGNNYQRTRYLRWEHRRPVKVISSEDYDEEQDRKIQNPKTFAEEKNDADLFVNTTLRKINWEQSRSSANMIEQKKKSLRYNLKSENAKPLSISKKIAAKETVDMFETVLDEDGNFIYTKMDNNDIRISNIMIQIKSKKEKENNDLILLEGKRLIEDAIKAGCKPDYMIFSRMKEIDYLKLCLPKLGMKLYKMPYREMQMWSELTTSPGIMGIFKVPDTQLFTPDEALPLTIICDNVREGNNLGAILRTCSGVGSQEIILTKGCVNVWDSKVLRTACGAHFKLRIKKKQEWEQIAENLPANSEIYIADNQTVSSFTECSNLAKIIESIPVLPYYGVNFTSANHIVLIVGGETEGISEYAYRFTEEKKGARLNVPLSNGIDSLNTGTALGIIAFEMKKQIVTKKN